MNAIRGDGTATIVVETFNVSEGQSIGAFDRAVRAAVSAATEFGDGNTVVVPDASGDERVRSVLAGIPGPVDHLELTAGTSYDESKDLAAARAETEYVAYLDADCTPRTTPLAWLRALVTTLEETGAPGAAGITVYRGRTAIHLALTVMDFGFLADAAIGPARVLGCYASNNVVFRTSDRTVAPTSKREMRCACYSHAQTLLRNGTPMVLAAHPDAIVEHELPAFFSERTRQGRDAVWAALVDPSCWEGQFFYGRAIGPWKAARFYRATVRQDLKRLPTVAGWTRTGRVGRCLAAVLVPILRVIDSGAVLRELMRADTRRSFTRTRDR